MRENLPPRSIVMVDQKPTLTALIRSRLLRSASQPIGNPGME